MRALARRRPERASLYDFRDLDLLLKIDAESNGQGIPSSELAEILGFEEGDNRPIGIRLAWMRRYGMVAYDAQDKLWSLTRGARIVTEAHLRAPQLKVVKEMPDAAAVELMAEVVSRYQGTRDAMVAQMIRREFLYGTQRRR